MAIMLYEHNLTAYQAALSFMNKAGKAAIIHPTGTGKSFIGFKLAEDHPDARILWLSPSEYIVKTQLENLRKEGGEEGNNIIFLTYARLMLMTEEEIGSLHPDFCIMDEYHRCGARQWQTGVNRLIQSYPQAKLLGLSATNIRYLDNQRDMAEELFDGNIASEMTLGETIVRGILPSPVYVLSVYAYQKELERYRNRIDAISNPGVRRKTEKELEELRRALAQAEGLDIIFRKYMKNRHGKYLVFCANKDHMDEMADHAHEWFSGVDPEFHLYRVYADYVESDQEFQEFKSDTTAHLKVLFCIDMLNEGVHVDDIDGVILFRPTISPIIYKQQIGRALCTGKGKTPVIFDIVNNFDHLYSINTIQEEMELAISNYRALGREDRIIQQKFRIIDETCDSRQLFDRLQKTLSSTWDTYYYAAKKYYEEYGNLNVKKNYITEDGLSLGMWIGTQRRVRNGSVAGTLTDGQIARLDLIGMVWENMQECRWNRGYEHAKSFYDEHGNLDVRADYVTEDGFPLGTWISNNRTWYRNNSHQSLLNQERVSRLDAIGMIWSKNSALWDRNIKEAKRYYDQYGNLNVPSAYVTENGVRLGVWIDALRKMRKTKRSEKQLSEEQIAYLDHMGMQWGNRSDEKWEIMYQKLLEYRRLYGHVNLPASYVTDDGMRLGMWLYHQKKKKDLSKERKNRLEAAGVVFEMDSWGKRYELARKYYEKHGNLDIPQQYKTEDHIWLGKWIYEQRKNKDRLTQNQIDHLNAIGMVWESQKEIAWMKKYRQAARYYQRYGNLNIPRGYCSEDGTHVDIWVLRQRALRRANKLTQTQISLLDQIGMKWETAEKMPVAG